MGDSGPAGGTVFYDKGYYSDGWRYLEVAPDSFYSVFGYYQISENSQLQSTGTAPVIGSGKLNTYMLVETMGDSSFDEYYSSKYAAFSAYNYSFGGYDDWYLPSRDEVLLIASLGLFGDDYYQILSSSEGIVCESNIWVINTNGPYELTGRYYNNGGKCYAIRSF